MDPTSACPPSFKMALALPVGAEKGCENWSKLTDDGRLEAYT